MSALFRDKSISIPLEEIIEKTEYPERLDLVIDEVLNIYQDKFSDSELKQIKQVEESDLASSFEVENQTDTISSSLDDICSQKEIHYSFDAKNMGDFVMEVDASHQAEVDCLLSRFSNTGVSIGFHLNTDRSFQLEVHNTNGVLPEEELVSMLEESLVTARSDVDYLETMPKEIKNSQVSFMASHPEVFDSYVYGRKKQNSFSENAQTITNAISSNDDHTIISTNPFGESVLINENTGDAIVSSVDAEEVRNVSLLSNVVHDRDAGVLGVVSGDEAIDAIETYRLLASEASVGGVDISVFSNNEDDKISILIEKKNNPEVQPIQMYCDKEEFEKSKGELIVTMDQDRETMQDESGYHLFSSDGSTLTISSNLIKQEDLVEHKLDKSNVLVFQKRLEDNREAFSTPFLLLFLVVVSMAISFLLLLFL